MEGVLIIRWPDIVLSMCILHHSCSWYWMRPPLICHPLLPHPYNSQCFLCYDCELQLVVIQTWKEGRTSVPRLCLRYQRLANTYLLIELYYNLINLACSMARAPVKVETKYEWVTLLSISCMYITWLYRVNDMRGWTVANPFRKSMSCFLEFYWCN